MRRKRSYKSSLRRPFNIAMPIRRESACWRIMAAPRCLGRQHWQVFWGDRLHTRCPEMRAPSVSRSTVTATQLMYLPERVFPALKLVPPMVEVLLVPFRFDHKAVGILWVVAHDEQRKFDREDERLIKF